jgi:hypothetical protein
MYEERVQRFTDKAKNLYGIIRFVIDTAIKNSQNVWPTLNGVATLPE